MRHHSGFVVSVFLEQLQNMLTYAEAVQMFFTTYEENIFGQYFNSKINYLFTKKFRHLRVSKIELIIHRYTLEMDHLSDKQP